MRAALCVVGLRSVPCLPFFCGCAAEKMWLPELELSGERLAQYRRLESAPGPQDQWRYWDDRASAMGQSLPVKGCEEARVESDVTSLLFDGIELPFPEKPPAAVLPDYPSVMEDRQRAAVELGRLAALGKIRWYREGSRPPGF